MGACVLTTQRLLQRVMLDASVKELDETMRQLSAAVAQTFNANADRLRAAAKAQQAKHGEAPSHLPADPEVARSAPF